MHPSTNLSIRIMDNSMNLSIRNLVISMKPLFGNPNVLFHTREYILRLTPITKDIGTLLWLDGG